LTRLVRVHTGVFLVADDWVWPLFDVGLRLFLAKSFLLSAMMRAMQPSVLIMQAPIATLPHWMEPWLRSAPGTNVQLLAAVLLVLGLFTQLSALTLLLADLAGAAQISGDAQLLICALLMKYCLGGAGPLSVDSALGGLASSALTVAATIQRATAWMRAHLIPLFFLWLRLWLAAALVAGPLEIFQSSIVPFISAPLSFYPVSLAVGALLAVGLATRYLALVLLFQLSIGAMMGWRYSAEFYWAMALALIALRGPGLWSIDALVKSWLRRTYPELDGRPAFSLEQLPRVVIVGAGFGGLACAESLRHTPVAVTLIDQANHHLFQPLLYQVATASLSPGDIAAPIRPLFRDAFNVRTLYGTVTGIDPAARVVKLASVSVHYDFLILATGATHGYFGNDAWQRCAPGLKRLVDATEIRRRLLSAFELAELTEDENERRALLTFLVVGGGPTGVELAGAIAELARLGMKKDFRRFDPAAARVILVQSGTRILPAFHESLSAIAQRSLEKLGVEVRVRSRVEMIDDLGVSVSGQRIDARTVLWAAGVVASPAGSWIGAPCDEAGRVLVGPDLSVPGHGEIFAIGDTAASKGWRGASVPGLAPAAKQAGVYVARTVDARVMGKSLPAPFQYRHWGSFAAIGRKAAVVDCGGVHLWGALAWWLWGALHVGLLVGIRNRIATIVNWFWSYITFRSAIRLITGSEASR
jgi:NADH dehydrogenase/putative oxidoreductase